MLIPGTVFQSASPGRSLRLTGDSELPSSAAVTRPPLIANARAAGGQSAVDGQKLLGLVMANS